MSLIREFKTKCSVEGHGYIELACLNETCKAFRIQCHQCLGKGDHTSHPKHQKDVNDLFEFFDKIGQESESLILKFCWMLQQINDLFTQLNQELRIKYQFSKGRLLQMNAIQLNEALDQVIKYDEIKTDLFEEVKQCSDNMIQLLQRQITELRLEEVSYPSLNLLEQKKVEELFQKGYKLYYDDDKYEQAIIQLDFALLYNPKHVKSLYIKSECLRMLGNYKEAIIWADKVISIDSKHVNSLYSKADSLKMIGNFKDAIIWADRAFSIDSKHVNSLHTKGESLRMLEQIDEAIQILDEALNYDPNHDRCLASKGACLQQLSRYQEAIVYFNKAIEINPNYEWAKVKKAECQKQLNNNK